MNIKIESYYKFSHNHLKGLPLSFMLVFAVIIQPLSAHAEVLLEEMIVTAQKREQNIQDIGGSINAFSGEDARRYANDIGALAGQAPGVESYGNGSYLQSFFIRGIGLNEFAGNYNAPVAIHKDEVYISKNWQAAIPVFDIDRVEILKGPQGTLFGRNTTGGAVNFFNNTPTQEFEAYIRGTADEHERYSLEGVVSGALSENLLGRLSVYSGFGSGGPQLNLYDGEDHGTPDVTQFRGQLHWQDDNTRVKLMVYGGQDDSDIVAYKGPGIFNARGPGFCPEAIRGEVSLSPSSCAKFNGIAALNGRPELETEPEDIHTINQNRPPEKNDSFRGGYFRFEYDFDNITFTSLTSSDYYERDQFEDSDSTPIESADTNFYNELDQFTQEFRLSGTLFDDRANFVLGVFYQQDDLRQADSAGIGVDNPFNLPPANAGLPPRLVASFDQEIESFAVFLNNEYQLNDKLAVITGIRYTREETRLDGFTNVGLNDVFGIEDLPATLFVPGGIDSVTEATSELRPSISGITSDTHEDTDTSWKLGLNYNFDDETLLYTNISTGFRTGGFSVPFGGIIVEFDKEEVTAFEAGIKTRFAGGRAQFNAAVFQTETENAQVNVDDPLSLLVPLTRNLPEVETVGFEAALDYILTDNLQFKLGVSYLDSEVTDSGGSRITTIATDRSTPIQGNRLVNTPEWQINGQVNYARPFASSNMAFAASLDFRWSDDRFLEITNQPSELADAYTVVNGQIGLIQLEGKWDISLFVKNLFDEEYLTYVNNLPGPGFKIDVFGETRTVGVSAGYNF